MEEGNPTPPPGQVVPGLPSEQSQKNKQKSDNLSQSKDRAQLTATTAMSVVHVALLKEVLDAGPQYATYYYGTLTLICICLGLQVIAGIISITLSHLNTYGRKAKSEPCNELCGNLCCCNIVCQNDEDEEEEMLLVHQHTPTESPQDKTIPSTSTKPEDLSSKPPSTTTQPAKSYGSLIPSDEMKKGKKKKKKAETGCCPCYIKSATMDDEDIRCLDGCEKLGEHQKNVELDNAAAKIRIERLKEITANARKKLLDIEKGGVEDQEEIKQIKELIKKANKERNEYEEMMVEWSILQAQAVIRNQQARELREAHVLVLTTFWQQVLNYILYIVFVLNAFIVGLGVATIKHDRNNQTVSAGATTPAPTTEITSAATK